ncbi:hypothetical protein JCM10908_005842 [Rhodotorula pacifica]|uniref:zinc-binding alcohol dehydrogenase family protein n=1 Tax=Rhodotorula pacifica TaxID=1495444 RepID=UPI00317E07AB
MSLVSDPPAVQTALLLEGPRQRYKIAQIPLPVLATDTEVLVRVDAIGLNPLDWKSCDYNFALPVLPALNGRDLAGTVVQVGSAVKRVAPGDRVFAVSTNYRDYRTSSFQEYAVAAEHCLGVVPSSSTVEEAAALGVGVSTAAIALSSCLGLSIDTFSARELSIGSEGELDVATLPPPIRSGDWLLIWGASTVTGFFAAQFASLMGVRVIAVACEEKHGDRLRAIGVDHVVDRHDPLRAIAEIRRLTDNNLKYAIDCVGSSTAAYATQALREESKGKSWIVGLSGLPKTLRTGVQGLAVPIKTFHTNPQVGRALMDLVERLLESNQLVLPSITILEGGLESVNEGLDRLRSGSVSLGRIVVRLRS